MAAQVVVPSTAIVHEVLNTDNYKDWSVRVKTYLLANDLWDAIEFEAPREDEPEFKAWTKKNAKALHAIQISCGHCAFSLIRNIDTAAEAWDTLAANFTPAAQEVEDDTGSGGASNSGAVTTSSRRQQAPPLDKGTGQFLVLAEADETVEMSDVQEKNCSHDNSHKHGRWYKDFPDHEALINDVANGNLDSVKELLATDPNARRTKGVLTGYTILHVAVTCDQVHVVKALVEMMTEVELEARSRRGFTALALAVYQHPASLTQMVKFMVEKNQKLLTQEMEPKNYIPLYEAYRHGKWELARYLYSVTPLGVLLENNGRYGAAILGMSFLRKEHGMTTFQIAI